MTVLISFFALLTSDTEFVLIYEFCTLLQLRLLTCRRFLGDAALRPADAEALAAALKPNTFLQARPGPVEQFGRNVKLHASMLRRSRKKGNILKTETLIYYVIKIWS